MKTYNIIALFIIILLYVVLNDVFAFVSWILFLLIGINIEKKINVVSFVRTKFILWYSIISIIGLLIHLDNFVNFGDYYGFAADDYKFFKKVELLINNFKLANVDLFSCILSVFIYPISLFKDISLLDLLPFNWALFSLSLLLIDKLCLKLTGSNVPIIIMLICLCSRFAVFDTVIRLYRDNLVLFFILLSLVTLLFDANKRKFILYLIPVFFLRAASVVFPLLIYLMWENRNQSKRIILLNTFLIVAVFLILYEIILPYVVIYGSSFERTSTYQNAFSELSVSELETMRQSMGEKYSYLSGNSIYAILGRSLLAYSFPLRFTFWFGEIHHYKLGIVQGYYFYYLFQNLMIISFIVTSSYLIGGFKCIIKNNNLLSLFCANIVFFIFYIIVSNQYRHAVPFYVINIVFLNYIYYNIKHKRFIKLLMCGITLIVILYNLN